VTGGVGVRGHAGEALATRAIRRPRFVSEAAGAGALERALFGLRDPVARIDPEGPGLEDACWRCASPVGPGEVDGAGCGWCRPRRLRWSRAVALGAYDGELREAVHRLKYHADRAAGRWLGTRLGGAISEMLERSGRSPGEVVLAPVPASRRRRMLRNRGVDHTLTLARAASATSGFAVWRALDRRHGPSQTALPASKRAANARRAFRARDSAGDFHGSTVILVDDVRTTGATLNACTKVLHRMLATRDGGVATGGHDGWGPIVVATAGVAVEGRRAPPSPGGGDAERAKTASPSA